MSSRVKDQLAIKFRLNYGSDIGPKNFPSVTSVMALKENVVAQWHKERKPRTAKDIKLISGGRILENSRTVAEYSSPSCDIPGGVITVHVVVQPTPNEKGKKLPSDSKQNNSIRRKIGHCFLAGKFLTPFA